MLTDKNLRWQYNRIEAAWLVKPMQSAVIFDTKMCTQHIVKIKYRTAVRKMANINIKIYNSLKRGVYRPDCT